MISNFSQLFEKMTENTLQIATNYLDIVQASKALNTSINIDDSLPEHTPWNSFGTKITTLLRDAIIVRHDDTTLHYNYREFSVCLAIGANNCTDKLDNDYLNDYKVLTSIFKIA